jgi:hypothetical protein
MFSAYHPWRGGRCPVMSLMSLEVDAVSPSHVTVFIFILKRKLMILLPFWRCGVNVWQ